MFDTEVYNAGNLKPEDKRLVHEMEYAKNEIFNNSAVETYLSEHCENGRKTTEILREILLPFMEHLKEQMNYHICDMIINAIEGYTSDELEMLMQSNIAGTERKGNDEN